MTRIICTVTSPRLESVTIPKSVTSMGFYYFIRPERITGYYVMWDEMCGSDIEIAVTGTEYIEPENITVYGYDGSVAEEFAELQGFEFVSIGTYDPDEIKDISECLISDVGIGAKAWTGSEIKPEVSVWDGTKMLKAGKDYTVSYKNNKAVGTAAITVTGMGGYKGTLEKTFDIVKPKLRYRAYVQKKNWMPWSTALVSGTKASTMAGTTDNLRMETIQMQLSGVKGAVKYRAYVEKMGWTQWATTADTTTYAGTKGLSRRVEMIQLKSSGEVATLYDMYYRTYCEKFGWLGWVKSGEKSGSAGYARKLEAFQINFVRKGEKFTVKSDTTKGFYDSAKDGKNPK